MTAIESLVGRLGRQSDTVAVIGSRGRCSFGDLVDSVSGHAEGLQRSGVAAGTVVGLEADFSPSSIALFLALIGCGAIVVPRTGTGAGAPGRREELAQVELRCTIDPHTDTVRFDPTGRTADHALYDDLRGRGRPGLVLFTSGTSGEPKAAVHDAALLLRKFEVERPAHRTLAFLLFDHMGGINTMLHTLSNGAALVTTGDRSPDAVCSLIERHAVELLPVTPTFLNLMLLGGAHRRHDLSSLRVISYGAEPMPPATLARLRAAFPAVKLQQTYGMIEVGVLRTRSASDESLWVEVGGEGFQTRVVDGMLEVRSRSMLLGYLNASAPITDDGWFQTGDMVEQNGEFLRFLGRATDLINVGGEKVYPAEVEGVIESMDEVAEALVFGERNAIVGQIVCARVTALTSGGGRDLARAVKRYCRQRLEPFKVPVKVEIVDDRPRHDRVKKPRGQDAAA